MFLVAVYILGILGLSSVSSAPTLRGADVIRQRRSAGNADAAEIDVAQDVTDSDTVDPWRMDFSYWLEDFERLPGTDVSAQLCYFIFIFI